MDITVNEIKEIISDADALGDVESLESNLPLTEQGVDSLDMANIYLMIEEKYAITIPHEDTDGLQSIDNILEYLSSKVK